MTATAIGSYATATLLKQMVGITDTTDDTLLGLICDRVNEWIEETTGRVLAPIASATYLYDGDGSCSLYLATPADKAPIGGMRAVTLVEVQPYTAAGYETVDSSQYFLRQQIGMNGPYERLVFTDYPTGTFSSWPRGFATVRVTGTAGWAAIPDDITEVALTVASRAWSGRQSGQVDVIGTDDMGRPLISRFVAGRDRDTLRRYTRVDKLV